MALGKRAGKKRCMYPQESGNSGNGIISELLSHIFIYIAANTGVFET
jgi:hypothetical protein